jgi:DHA1 family chloramphenicol resistance protein-like MFS transporter
MDVDLQAPSTTVLEVERDRSALDAPVRSYPSDSWVLLALCSGTFVASLLTLAPPPFFPVMARDLQVEVPLLGQLMTAMLLLSALFSLPFGPISDRSGHRRLILVGLVAAIATLLTFGLAPAFLVLMLASVTGAVTTAAVPGPALALAGTHFAGAAGRRAVSWTSGSAALAAIVGVPGLAALGAVAGWRLAYLVLGAAAVIVFGVAVRGLPPHRSVDEPRRPTAVVAPYRPLLRDATMQRLYAARALSGACWMGLLTYLGVFLADAFVMDGARIGLVYMAGGTTFFLGSLAAGGLLARVPARLLVGAGYLTMALLMGLAFSARLGAVGTGVLIAAAALAMGLGGVGMAMLFLAETPSGAGTTMTLSGAVFNLGAAGGGAIGGVLLALAGYDAVAIGLPLLGLVAALLSWRSPVSATTRPARRWAGNGGPELGQAEPTSR